MTGNQNDGKTLRDGLRENHRETGARKLKERPDLQPETDQNAAMPKKPEPYGLTQPLDKGDEDGDRL